VNSNNTNITNFGENGGTYQTGCSGNFSGVLFTFSYDTPSVVDNTVGSYKVDIYKNDVFFMQPIINGTLKYDLTQITLTDWNKYKGICYIYNNTNASGTPIATKIVEITIDRSSCPTNSLTISTNKTSLCPGEATTLTATTNCTAASISWQKDGAAYGVNGATTSVSSSGTYKALCNSPAMASNIITVNVSNTPTVPNIKTNRNSITPGEFATLTATNCQGTVVWQGSNNFTDIGNEISVGQPGNYQALCRSNCNGTLYYSDLSTIVGISLLPLRLEADKYEKYSNETPKFQPMVVIMAIFLGK
jgi:hypothetical protein